MKMEPTEKLTTGIGTGERKNKGKIRFDLAPFRAQKEYAKVWTDGAIKYTEHGWEGGMRWTVALASAERHLMALKAGEDIDPENGRLHAAELMANASMIAEYHHTFKEGDDRRHGYLVEKRICLDIDMVLADFVTGYMETFDIKKIPEFYSFDRKMGDRLKSLPKDWWLALKPLSDPSELGFEPVCYLTSRIIPNEVSMEWLDKNHFPAAPCYTVKNPDDKLAIAIENKIDIMVDDRFETFRQFNNAGLCCLLFDAAHNRRYNVGHKRIKSLSELTKF